MAIKKSAPTGAIRTDGWILPKGKEELAQLRKKRKVLRKVITK